jgi:hypothetical protein
MMVPASPPLLRNGFEEERSRAGRNERFPRA